MAAKNVNLSELQQVPTRDRAAKADSFWLSVKTETPIMAKLESPEHQVFQIENAHFEGYQVSSLK